MQPVAEGGAVHGLRGRPAADSVGSVQHHDVVAGRYGVERGGQAGDACANDRHSNHKAARGCE